MEFINFRSTQGAIGPGDAKQEMQQLQPYFIAGALIQVIADTLCGDLPIFNNFIKSPEDGICPRLPIGALKILPHVIKLSLAHLPVGFDHDGTQGK